MSWDIYGGALRRGHCEVHPHIHEEYPCSVCMQDSQRRESQRSQEDQYHAEMERAHNAHIEQMLFEDGAYYAA